MTKRKLTQRQTARVRSQQRVRVERLQQPNEINDDDLGPEQQGLIISHFGRQVEIEALEGELCGTLQRCHLRANLEALVTGDRVVWRAGSSGGVIVACLPRRSLLARPDVHLQQPKPVAANVDRIVIVIAPEPQPYANLIDRYLVAAEAVAIPPLLLLNKSDLLDAARQADIVVLLEQYRAIGYPVLQASTKTEHGLDALRAELCDRISVFVGQSGVGKSSLIRALIPGIDIRIGELSAVENKGRHTTTTARLFHLPDGGDLIDSPGIREFGLDHLDRAQIENGFIEFREWLGHCRFRDCHHESEPGCAIRTALGEGLISAARMRSFETIINQTG
ncbi:MAG TPA: small ribosomal subunit biogenesis GTPase RsgA [Spongiibacteraceae bacterium]